MTTRGGTPTEAQRLDQYRRNAALSLRLEASGDLDWAITTMFYAVVHLVDTYLARSAQYPSSHKGRRDRHARDPNWSQMMPLYLELEDRSLDARYRCRIFSATEVHELRTMVYGPLELQLRAWLGI